MTRQPVAIMSGRSYLEGPRWHDGRIWVSDMYTFEVLSCAEDGSDPRVEAEVVGQPSGLGWLPDGRLLVASMIDRTVLRREADGDLVVHAELSALTQSPVNDMVVDAAGRAYIGSFGFDLMAGAPMSTASLFRIDPDGTVTEVADGLWFPNGMVITDDGELLVNESFGNRISAFPIGPDGTLGDRRDWARFGDPPTPGETDSRTVLARSVLSGDGAALAPDGTLWVADVLASRAVRVCEGGRIVDEIALGTGVFACALGGADGRSLFLCTAPDSAAKRRRRAREAQLLAVRV